MAHSQARSIPSSAPATSTALPPLHVARSETREDDRAALHERYRLGHVRDDALHEGVKKLVGRHNVLTADLLAHLAEVDARGIYRERACSSLYTYASTSFWRHFAAECVTSTSARGAATHPLPFSTRRNRPPFRNGTRLSRQRTPRDTRAGAEGNRRSRGRFGPRRTASLPDRIHRR
jgi:hypothetical protein